jgi:hypothetical protein
MSNPALTSILLWQFLSAYQKVNTEGAPLSLAYIVLPIVMSRHIVDTFRGTNVRTGFLTWLIRNPQLTLQLPRRVETTRDLTAEALRFGIAYRLFSVSREGTLRANPSAISSRIPRQHGVDERAQMLRIADHLGQWTSTLPEATVFYSIGMTP